MRGLLRTPARLVARALVVILGASIGLVAVTLPAWAEPPPPKLPLNASEAHLKFQPAMDYDKDGCYPSVAIGDDGELNPGLEPTGALDGSCRDESDLVNSNMYARSRCNTNRWCAHMYGLYFQKDQTTEGGCPDCGHRHDWEHIVVWTENDQVRYVAASRHGGYDIKAAAEVEFENGTHPKIVYHKDGGQTHAFRFADANQPLNNHWGKWHFPDLVSWNGYPPGLRDKLIGNDFDHATFALKDTPSSEGEGKPIFEADLNKARPFDVTSTVCDPVFPPVCHDIETPKFPFDTSVDGLPNGTPDPNEPVDRLRPTPPSNLRWTAVTADSVSLEWDASTDNVGVTGYAIYRNHTFVRVDGTTTYTDRNLPPDTAHTYTVTALDAAGNISAESNAVTVTTESAGETAAGAPIDNSPDDRAAKPEVSVPHSQCRPEGMAATRGVDAPYCKVYDAAGREWLGGRDKRVVGYFSGWRTGENDEPRYLVPNIPWSKVSHVNYAFAKVENNRISVGDTSDPKNPATGMTWPYAGGAAPDPTLDYKGHFNLLAVYKKRHPQVKTLISVGGWADSRNFYTMATTADGGVNQEGINDFADSVVEFLDRYKQAFDGVDIDYEYPSALPKAGNPADWDLSDPRRKGLQKGYNALMKTLRAKLDVAGAARGRYYLLTSAASASGYLVRGFDAGDALKYQDFINLMTYDLHGSWNHFVGPQAPLYDDGKDAELQTAQVYSTTEYDKTGYFNIDWAYHYYRGALPPGRINIGIPYYTRGWQNVTGGTDGLWGTAAMPDQGQCQPGTGPGSGAANPHPCGNGAVGIDNIWHDLGRIGNEVPSGSNPLWHTKNLQQGVTPGYLSAYTDPAAEAGKMKGSYAEKYDSTLKASWLWNADKNVFLSTENNASIDAKIDYVKQNKLGGVMMWELAGDYTQRANGEYGMGYDLTTRLDNGLRGSGGYQTGRAGATTLPGNVVDVQAELVNHPTGPDPAFPSDDPFYPMRPTLRITNNTSVKLPYGTQIAFDIPTSAPPILKDAGYQDFGSKIVITKGRSGANVGGLKADFHRVTVTIGYCEDVAPGASRDIVLRHYLPLTGPANVTVKIGANTYGSTQNDQKGATTVTPVVSGGIACQAEQWQRHPYNPHGTFAFDKDGTSWRIVDWVGGNVLDHPTTWQVAHLVENQPGNQNQLWTVTEDGGAGWYRIKNRGKCLQADGILKQLSVYDCDGRPNQWWQLLRTDNGTRVTGAPVPGTGYHLAGFADTSYTVAYLAEGKNSGNVPGTPAVAGAPDGSTASTVFWNNFLWRANWWTTATDEPGISAAWTKLGPTLQKVGTSSSPSAPRSIVTSQAPVPSDAPTGPPVGHERDPITITNPSTKPKAP
ncbi:Chitodextrinase precursor [[Actinomadura] parvosata subsp. kistnae]|uniref:Chitinase n=1 Tax=[Actinomadura] parvosata subsp. kistnae TaxID=1909395 RepID=A0A1U9ZX91_9ACTN|nr:glycosyl hydrolase family 18 protein [Nonomuraea sp. ATCC 55076]AQZ62539.1 hypothetical protein BKM31_14670 [Nonomuraea sp. ATCC 55076]SPL88799.1 Chitodextrinase precursor [Actinomadura parvosata subsp. kistnae]